MSLTLWFSLLTRLSLSGFLCICGLLFAISISQSSILMGNDNLFCRTDPASRIAVWDVLQIQEEIFINNQQQQSQPSSQR